MGFKDALYDFRTQREQRRSERRQEKAMNTPVFKYASALYVDDPYSWGQEEFEQVMEDANEELRQRRMARVVGLLVVILVWGSGFYAAWSLKPGLVECDIVVQGEDLPNVVECQGVN